jgi:hypothetical protein
MNEACRQFTDDWDLLALDGLEEERALELRAHLATGCEACGKVYAESLAAARVLARAVPDAYPSRHVESRLRAQMERQAARDERRRWTPVLWPWAAVAASLALAGWLGWDRARLERALSERAQAKPAPIVAPAPVFQSPATPLPAVPPPAPVAGPADSPELKAELARLQAELRDSAQANRLARQEWDAEKSRLESAREEAAAKAARFEKSLKEVETKLAVAPPATPAPAEDPKLAAELARLKDELNGARRSLDTQTKQLAEYRRVFRALEGSVLRQVDMRSVDAGGGQATARALFSSDGGLILLARGLPRLPANKCYQLWIVRKGGPAIVSGGLLQTDTQGRGILFAGSSDNLRDATGFAITDEPEGGSVSARGRKLLFGAL